MKSLFSPLASPYIFWSFLECLLPEQLETFLLMLLWLFGGVFFLVSDKVSLCG